MGAQNEPAKRVLARASGFDVCVISTNSAATRAAVAAADKFARELDAQIRILVTYVVPYPLPLDHPPVDVQFLERDFVSMIDPQSCETSVEVCLCRDRLEAIRERLKPESIVVIGGGTKWWRAGERRMANDLRRRGHRVIVVNA